MKHIDGQIINKFANFLGFENAQLFKLRTKCCVFHVLICKTQNIMFFISKTMHFQKYQLKKTK